MSKYCGTVAYCRFYNIINNYVINIIDSKRNHADLPRRAECPI